jgi:hypothetical protein
MIIKTQSFSPDDYAIEINNIYRLGKWISNGVSNSKDKDFPGGDLHGTPVSRKYQHLNGYFKYSLTDQDTAQIEVAMYKNAENIGMGRLLFSGNLDQFSPFDLLITYQNDTIIPDSVIINFNTKNRGESVGDGSLIIDRLSFDGFWGTLPDTTSGADEHTIIEEQIKVYPNPAKNNFTVELSESLTKQAFAQLMDIDGRIINQLNLPPGQTRFIFDASDYTAGIYFIKVSTQDKTFNKKIVIIR